MFATREMVKKIPGARSLVKFFRRLDPVARLTQRKDPIARKNDLYDSQTVEVMKRVLQETSICIDVGAHKGDVLREILAIAPNAKHFAVEALPHFAQGLRDQFPRVTVLECAVSDKNGTAEFHHVTSASGYSGLLKRDYDELNPVIEQIVVDVKLLDELVPDDTHISLIKVDIEGGEFNALKGATKILSRDRPTVVFEAGSKSSGHYGVDQNMFFDFFEAHNMHISTMGRYLTNKPAFSREEHWDSWTNDFYFVAYAK